MTVDNVHPRDPETGQIGSGVDTHEFVESYIEENATLPSVAKKLIG